MSDDPNAPVAPAAAATAATTPTVDAWEARLALARERLAPALLLAGEWVGDGQAHGEPITAKLRVRPILDGTALEVWEQVGDDHEDLSIYRYDPDSGQLEVIHFMAGSLNQHPVELTPDGLVWVTPPSQPAVVWTNRGAFVESEVVWPGQRIAEVKLTYRRA
ncbi:MAG: hypothetical protein Q8P41_07325 [Pseudomonadota bacterium]|nr:hypothetical protein [Pseudomonadota bacterium]